MADSTADTVAQAFISGWVSHFRVPSTITADQEQQFESTLWKHLMHLLGTHHIWITAYHSISNGLVEHFHCQLKGELKCPPDTTHYTKTLPIFLLGSYMYSYQARLQMHCYRISRWHHLEVTRRFFTTTSTNNSNQTHI